MNLGAFIESTLPPPQRGYLEGLFKRLRDDCSSVHIPFSGALELAHAAVFGGFAPPDVHCSDVTFVGLVMGTMAAGRTVDTLSIEFSGDLQPFNELVAGKHGFGAALVGWRAGQLRPEVYFEQIARREICKNRAIYAERMQRDLLRAIAPVAGLDFQPIGVWSHLESCIVDVDAAVVVNPPLLTDGVTAADKRAAAMCTWAGPELPGFNPRKSRDQLYDLVLGDPKALCVVVARHQLDQAESDRVIFAHEHRADRLEYILCSRPDLVPATLAPRAETRVSAPIWPLVSDGFEITDQTRIDFVPTTREVALYLRDLWAHKLGATRSENYFLFLLDGHAAGVFGMFFDHFGANRSPHVSETFGFNVAIPRYKRLNKLMMMCLVSRQARDFFVAQPGPRNSLLELTTFQTTCISSHPELKTNRGLMKLRERRDLPGGRYYLNYVAPFNAMSFHDCLLKWLAKDADVGEKPNAAATT
ncbi:MAG TPA: hypothetical protein VIJ94_06430 [Caulobacteraceae bacterium]